MNWAFAQQLGVLIPQRDSDHCNLDPLPARNPRSNILERPPGDEAGHHDNHVNNTNICHLLIFL